MKRSEMIKDLVNCYFEYIPDYGVEYVVDRMLRRAENRGMLPPETQTEERTERWCKTRGSITSGCDIWESIWEKEDEIVDED